MADRYASLADRFGAKVNKSGECWIWTGARKSPTGYGSIRLQGRQLLAHRVSLQLAGVDVPDDMTVDHLCANKGCVRPDHLEVVSRGENVRRWARTITECPKGHPYDEANTRVYRGKRTCLACRRVHAEGDGRG